MTRVTSTESWGRRQDVRQPSLQASAPKAIDNERLIWDPEYRKEVRHQLKAAARSG